MSLEADVRALLVEGARTRVFEQAAVAVVRGGAPVLSVSNGNPTAIFDVASLTKVFTATLALKLLPMDASVSCLRIPCTVGNLLAHRAGLRAWAPFFARAALALGRSVSELVRDSTAQEQARQLVRGWLAEETTGAAVPTYSDVGFLALGFDLERATGRSLGALAQEHFFEQLGLRSAQWGGENPSAVPTGTGRPRPGNPRVVGEPEPPSDPGARDHAVDDDNAAALGGVVGHAGLWISAPDVAVFGDALRSTADGVAGGPLPPTAARRLFEPAVGSRTFGLDGPSGDLPALGSILGKGPRGAAGHTGFTGCSVWMDRDTELTIAFLSNAVAIERPNPRIRTFRPRLHDLIASALV